MKFDFEITEELDADNEMRIYQQCWKIGKHESIFKIGSRYFQIYDGPEWDSWQELFV